MIGDLEIKEFARSFAVPESTIEKDYALGWILYALNRQTETLVLKGGTGIRKTYIEGFRFSEDLDFTVLLDIDLNELEGIVKKALSEAGKQSGINFSDVIKSKENHNGYQIDTYFRILRQTGTSPLRIKFDLTKYGTETLLTPPEKREIFHPYSDNFAGQALVYSLDEIMAEKLRSIFERIRPRDLYDIWYICKKFNVTGAVTIFPQKCEAKNVKPNIQSIIERKENFSSAWENSLKHQLKELPEFESVFTELILFLKTFVIHS